MGIFDWVGALVSSACHHDVWQQGAAYPYDAPPTINPASGMPMVGNSGVDIHGNPFGIPLSSWRDDWKSSSGQDFHHMTPPSYTMPHYDPIRGW